MMRKEKLIMLKTEKFMKIGAAEATEMDDMSSPVVDSNFIVTRIRDEQDQEWDTRKAVQHSISGDQSNLQSHGVWIHRDEVNLML